MTKKISRFSIHATAKICALLYGLFGVVAGAIFFLVTIAESAGAAVGMLIVMPLLYGGFGYIGTALFCWLYNLVAGKCKAGITFELEDVE